MSVVTVLQHRPGLRARRRRAELGVEAHLLAESAEVLDVVGAEGAEAHRVGQLASQLLRRLEHLDRLVVAERQDHGVGTGVLGGEDELLEVGGAGGDLRQADDLGAVGLGPSST